jgi:hypothetical protein
VMQPQHRSAKIRIDRLPGNAWDEAGSSREWVGECPRGSFAGRPAGTRRVNVRGATDFVVFEAGRDGFWLARWLRARASSLMLSTRRVLPCHEGIVARRLIALTPNILNGSSSGGCAVSRSLLNDGNSDDRGR